MELGLRYRRLFYSALFFYLFTIMQMLLIADYGSKDAALWLSIDRRRFS